MMDIAEHALGLAEKYDATLHVMYVVDTQSATPDPELREAALEYGEEFGREAIEKVAEAAEERGIDVEREMPSGVPSEQILGHAKGKEMDLIVMGTHGRTGLDRYMVGSVAEKVLRHSGDIPVLLVREING